jgi:hypothetical protein
MVLTIELPTMSKFAINQAAQQNNSGIISDIHTVDVNSGQMAMMLLYL